MKKVFFTSLLVSLYHPALADEQVTELADFSFEELLNIDVATAGKFMQSTAQAPAVISIITKEDIALYGGQSLLQVLERLPSVQMMGSFFYPQNLAVIRGTQLTHSNNEVLVLINGRPLRDSFTGGQNFALFSAFPVTSIKQIEFIRGPGSVLYGSNAFMGVINVITHKTASKQFTVNIGENESVNSEVNWGDETAWGYWNLSSKLSSESGWEHSARDNNGNPGEFDAGENNISVLFSGQTGELTWSSAWLQSEQDFWGAVSSWSGQPPQDQRKVKSTRSTIDLGYKLHITDAQYLDSNLSFSSSNFSHYNYDADSRNWLLETTWHHTDIFKGHLLAGATIWHQKVDTQDGLSAAPIPAFTRNWKTAYLQFQTQDFASLNGFFGIQYNKVPEVSGNWVYRGGINWAIDQNQGVKLLWGEAFRAAYAVETNFDLIVCCDEQGNNRGGLRGNSGLEPEEIATLELQYYVSTEQSRWSLTAFSSKLTNLIGRLRATDRVLDFVNTGSLDSEGLEFELKHYVDASMQLDASITWQRNSAHGIDDYTLMPDWLVKLGIAKTFNNGATLSAFLNAQDDFHSNQLQNPTTAIVNPEATQRMELSVQYRHPLTIFSDVQSYFSIYISNALDDELYQPEIAGRNINTHPAGAGRRIFIGISSQF